jgi:glucose/mannose transport system substrate-binding protein
MAMFRTRPTTAHRVGLLTRLGVGVAAVAVVVAACSSSSSSPAAYSAATQAPAESTAATQGPAESAATTGELEIFHEWTSGSENAAVQAVIDAYTAANPGITVTNSAVALVSNRQAALLSRLQGGDPPDSWLTHQYYDVARYVPDFLQPITDLYQSEGWDKVIPADYMKGWTIDGQQYAVSTGAHRNNVVFYNKKVFEDAGLGAPTSMTQDEMLAAFEKIKANGVDPICIGDVDAWATAQIMESAILGYIGPDKWADLWRGKLSFSDPQVQKGLELYGKILQYQNADHSSLTWDQAVDKVIEGRCAVTVMGDWAGGELKVKGAVPEVDWGWFAFPGTDGVFLGNSDGFGIAKGLPADGPAAGWLKTIMQPEVQAAFNQLKGSSPVRTDTPLDGFNPYQLWAINDFRTGRVLPDFVNGEAAPPDVIQAVFDATVPFVTNGDLAAYTAALNAATGAQ